MYPTPYTPVRYMLYHIYNLFAGLQAAVTPLGDKGVPLIPGILTLNMYTATGWINVLLGVFNCILFLPSIFRERRIAAREAMMHHGMESGTLLQTIYICKLRCT
jgi:hypothetical protein